MAMAQANGIEIEYEAIGAEDGDPLLLVMGLGAQLIHWPQGFCERLASGGMRVIRFDNRDIGLSTKFDDAGTPNLIEVITTVLQGGTPEVVYTIDDMAADAVGLLDALGIERAHIAGASLGGQIVQTMAYRHPDRVKTLTSIMMGTGSPTAPQAQPEAMQLLLTPPPTERDARIAHGIKLLAAITGKGHPTDEATARELTIRAIERSDYIRGGTRQVAASLAQGDREPHLATITAPTLVLHGADDPLVPVGNAHMAHAAIPGSTLKIVEGWGHDVPPSLEEELADILLAHVRA